MSASMCKNDRKRVPSCDSFVFVPLCLFTMADKSSAIALFHGAKRASTDDVDKLDQQKRDASKRNTLLKQAPTHIRDKWQAICDMNPKDGNKNALKTEFTKKIIDDAGEWQDSYWMVNAREEISTRDREARRWVILAKAIAEHGGGEAGKVAIDDALKAGLYTTRKRGGLQEIGILESSAYMDTVNSLSKDVKGGGQSSQDHIVEATRAVASRVVMKRPASQMVIDVESESSQPPAPKKKPSASAAHAKAASSASVASAVSKGESIAKRPAAKSAALSQASLQKHDEDMMIQNKQLNVAVANAHRQLVAKSTRLLEVVGKVITSSNAQLGKMMEGELTTCKKKVDVLAQDGKHMRLIK